MDGIILLSMIFAHVFADYVFQNNFMSLYKQKKTWDTELQNVSDKKKQMYKHDYIVVLIVHSFSWAFITYLPLLYYECYWYYILLVVVQTPIHAYVDHVKCNEFAINLITDQLIHLFQIVAPFIIYKIFI